MAVPNTPVDAPTDDPMTVAAVPSADAPLTSRYLMIKNETTESWTVWVEYYTVNANGEGVWVSGDKALEREVKPGEQSYVRDDHDVRIRPRAIRIWAESEKGQKWVEYKEVVLDLVGEKLASKNATCVIAIQAKPAAAANK